MDWATMLLIAVGLAMDAFAVSLAIGTNGSPQTFRSLFRVSFHMGLFQGLMTILGWLAGSTIAGFISAFDHWIALGLLAAVGISMIQSGVKGDIETPKIDLSRGGTLIMACVATSIDAMAVGLSMAMLDTTIWLPALVIGVVTLGLSLFGMKTGKRLGQLFGKRMEILGGFILVAIGVRILVTHLA